MAIPWIELQVTMPDHPKVVGLARSMRIDKDLAVGKLVRLWTWALTNRETGKFAAGDEETIAEVMRFKGKPELLVDAMVTARLLDKVSDGWQIHDWEERVGMLLARRDQQKEKTRERVRRYRERLASDSANGQEGNALPGGYSNGSNASTLPHPTITPSDFVDGFDEPDTKPVKKPRKAFVPPTVDEVRAYCTGRNNKVDPQKFVDHYTTTGWFYGKTKMQDWKSAVRTWENRDKEKEVAPQPKPKPEINVVRAPSTFRSK